MERRYRYIVRIGLSVLGFLITVSLTPISSFAQFYGGGAQGSFAGPGFGPGGGGIGGPGGAGGVGGAGGQGQVLVKYGEKVYDAMFGTLVDYNVVYISVPVDTIGEHYFDDGTHGDEIAYDGIPSNITVNRDTYLGPFTIRYKNLLQNAIEQVENMGPHEFYDVLATSISEESNVPSIQEYDDRFSDLVEDMRSNLAQYQGYNDQRYVKSVDPALFESQQGTGGGGFGGQGQIPPDLPHPPGIPEPDVRQGMRQGQQQGGPGGQQQQGGQFNPVQRAQDASQQAEGQQQGTNQGQDGG